MQAQAPYPSYQGGTPPPYPPPQPIEGQTPITTYMMGVVIAALLTGVLIIVDDFGGGYWNNSYAGVEGYVWLGAFNTVWGFLILMPLSAAMFYTAFWSFQVMRDPRRITVHHLDRFFKLSLAIGIVVLVLGMIWAGYAISEEYDDWWFDTAFYGGMIGGFLTAIILYQAKKQAQSLGYPA